MLGKRELKGRSDREAILTSDRFGRGLRVCQVLFSLKSGGAEVLAARLARRLSGPFQMSFACLEECGDLGNQLRADGFDVHVLGRRPGIDLGCARRIADLMWKNKFDLIHAHQYGPFFYSAIARFLGIQIPIILTEHGRAFPDTTSRTHHLVNRLLLRPQDRVIGVGNDVRRVLIEKEGFHPGRVEVVYNGIDLAAHSGESLGRQRVRRDLGLAADDFVIVQVARLQQIKDHFTAIRAIETLSHQIGNIRLVLVGDGPEFGPVSSFVAERGLTEFVRMLGCRWDVASILQAADVALLTSVSEGIPLSLIEGMAAGLPIVSTCVGGVPEVVLAGETGFLAPAGDSEAIALYLHKLATNSELRLRLGAAGRTRAWEMFTEDRMVEEYRELYWETLGRRCPNGDRSLRPFIVQGA